MMNRFDRIEHFCQQAIVWLFCAAIFFLPASIAMVESFATLGILFYFIKKITAGFKERSQGGSFLKGLTPQAGFLTAPLWVNTTAILISVLVSVDIRLSFVAFVGKFLEGVAIYVTLVEGLVSVKDLKKFIIAFLISGAIVSLSGVVQLFTHYDFLRGNMIADGRISSSFRHANDFGAYLIVWLALVFSILNYYIVACKQKKCWGMWGAALLGTVAIGLTYSRSSWLGFLLAIIIIGYWLKNLRSFLCYLLLFLFIFLPLMVHFRNVSFVSDDVRRDNRAVTQGITMDAGSVSPGEAAITFIKKVSAQPKAFVEKFGGMGRSGFWKEAVAIIRSAPAFGTGLNTYSKVAVDHKINWGGYPHNCYLQMAAEIGLVGLGAFIFLIIVLIQAVIRALKVIRHPYLRAVAIAGAAGLIGFLFQSLFDTTLYSVQLGTLMWVIIGITVAAIQIDRRTPIIDKH